MTRSFISGLKGLAIAQMGAVALVLSLCSVRESLGQEVRKTTTVRVQQGEATVVAEPRTAVVVDRGVTRRTFRVADIRSPDIGIWFDPAATDSLVIADIATTGPIATLGFEEGDRILEVNHVKVTRETDFIKLLFATKARDGRVEVLVVRKNKEMVIPVEPALLEEYYVVVRQDPIEQLGFVVDDRYDDRVVVWKVIPRSPAFYAGFRPGDVITKFGDQRVVERKAFTGLVEKVQPGVLAVEVDRAKRVRPLRIEVPREWSVGYRGDVKVETDAPPRRDAPPAPPREPREDRKDRQDREDR
jgi:S1-C subfamily serine protease